MGFWLGRVAPGSRQSYLSNLGLFVKWLQHQPSWGGVDAKDLLVKHSEAEDQYAILDLLQKCLGEVDRSLNAKKAMYVAVRSFFIHNRCALPQDPSFRVQSSKAPVMPKLTVEHVCDAVKAANLRDRSIILVKWQSMQDTERLVYIGKYLSEQLVSQIKRGIHPIRLDIPKRKTNTMPYYTFIGKDAVDALVAYFEKERGWPKSGEPIWIQKRGGPVTKTGFFCVWMSLLRRGGLIPRRKGPPGSRYGYGSHDTRDAAKSLLHTRALGDGFDMEVAKFLMGHGTDKYHYDKFNEDQEYVPRQYLIAEKYLNILSHTMIHEEQRRQEQERIQRMEKEMEKMRKDWLEVRELLTKLPPETGPESIR